MLVFRYYFVGFALCLVSSSAIANLESDCDGSISNCLAICQASL